MSELPPTYNQKAFLIAKGQPVPETRKEARRAISKIKWAEYDQRQAKIYAQMDREIEAALEADGKEQEEELKLAKNLGRGDGKGTKARCTRVPKTFKSV